ncbi:hypothetical protein CDAR_315621 [Caerostris darwini]|uniref:Uncharacterized protein n=1 Tax=Caerostris darwini TaxID=1538125 RepID=A0AAV4TS07_9ARAC|nr:hypothetical protein CDAR_315621 [Caerostris darwini]
MWYESTPFPPSPPGFYSFIHPFFKCKKERKSVFRDFSLKPQIGKMWHFSTSPNIIQPSSGILVHLEDAPHPLRDLEGGGWRRGGRRFR